MLRGFGGGEEITSKMVMAVLRRADIRTKKCKGKADVFASHGKTTAEEHGTK